MRLQSHLRLLVIVTIAWVLFLVAGLPDYYQQYSTTFMILFDLAILPPIWYLVYRSIKSVRPERAFIVALWWSVYISVPLLIYDYLFLALYLGQGIGFLWKYWYLTVYYILPWLIFPATGWMVEKKAKYNF